MLVLICSISSPTLGIFSPNPTPPHTHTVCSRSNDCVVTHHIYFSFYSHLFFDILAILVLGTVISNLLTTYFLFSIFNLLKALCIYFQYDLDITTLSAICIRNIIFPSMAFLKKNPLNNVISLTVHNFNVKYINLFFGGLFKKSLQVPLLWNVCFLQIFLIYVSYFIL